MAVLDDPSQYYAPPQADWALGDIVVVPVGVLWKQGERPAEEYPQPAPPADGSASVVFPLWRGLPQLPDPLIECWLTPAMIVVDDCVIDKEFNAFIERRISEDTSVADAETEARANVSLDPLVAVAPILPYRALRAVNEQAVRQGNALGYFPVIDSEEMDEGYVDFLRTVPVSRQLLWGPVAAISDPARRILRWKLAQFYGFRNLSVDAEIMAAIGKTITNVRVITDTKNRLVVDLELDGGAGQLQLRQEPRRTEIAAGHQRGRPGGVR
jgi:hypothetical protein